MGVIPTSRRGSGPGPVAAGWVVWLAVLLLGWPGGGSWAAERDPRFPADGDRPPLGRGVFLVASPYLLDPNFRETVVLLCDHGPDGTLGLVVNRPSRVRLEEALPAVPALRGTGYPLFIGGPVQPRAVLLLLKLKEPPAATTPVLEGVYLGGDPELIEKMLSTARPGETFRAYAGYAGWAPGQLESEMAVGSWATVKADPAAIFDGDAGTLWEDMIRALAAPRVIRAGMTPPTVREVP